MHEIADQLMILLRDGWRFRWWGATVAWVVAVLGWLVVAAIPNQYEATAKVYVDTDSMLKPLLRGIAAESMDVGEKMALVATELLSGPVLERVARNADLGLNASESAGMREIVEKLRERVDVKAELISRATWPPQPPNLYTLGSRDSDPKQALAIVKALLDVFVEDAIGGTRTDTGAATDFLRRQIAEYEARLVATESRLTEFRRTNIGRLPEQGQTFFTRLRDEQAALDEVELELRQEQNRRISLESQLAGISPIQRATTALGTIAISPLEQRVQTMEARLDELLLQYTDNHPEVVSLRNSLELLKTQMTDQSASPNQSGATANPMFQELRLQLGQTEANIAAITVRRDEFARRVQALQEQMQTLPQIEAELGALTRDYEVTKLNYNELLTRLESAQMRTDADQTGEGVNFRIVEPPVLPVKPFFPNRLLLGTVVLIFAIGAGFGVAVLLSKVRPVFTSLSDISSRFDLLVLGTVGQLVNPDGVILEARVGPFVLVAALLIVSYVGVAATFLLGFHLPLV